MISRKITIFSILLSIFISFNYAEDQKDYTSVYSDSTEDVQIISDNDNEANPNAPTIINKDQHFDPPSFKNAFFKMVIALIALIILVVITFYSLRRLNRVKISQANKMQSIKILEKRPISPKSMLYLVEVDGEKVLISESNLEVRPIQAIGLEKLDN